MYNACVIEVEGFHLWDKDGEYNAMSVKYDKTKRDLMNTRVKTYRLGSNQ